MTDWPGTPSGQIAERWPGTPAQAAPPTPAAPQWPGTPALAAQPSPETAGQPGNPIVIKQASPVQKAVEPITSIPSEYGRIVGESVDEMKAGVKDIGEGNRVKGALKTGLGAMRYAFSPIEAPVHTIVGKPLEENLGIPHAW